MQDQVGFFKKDFICPDNFLKGVDISSLNTKFKN
jgi:hypothetical protein